MFNLQLTRKHILAIFWSLLVVIGLVIITNTISLFVAYNITRVTPISEIRNGFSQQPALTINWLLRTISFLSPFFGGVIVGWIIKERSWLYGGLLGLVLILISIIIVSYTLFLPTSWVYGLNYPASYGHDIALQNILNQLSHAPIIIILTSIGGFLGEKLFRR